MAMYKAVKRITL